MIVLCYDICMQIFFYAVISTELKSA